ncbi:hypothetical protein K1719_027314 [Acacia pycnantha]|nr:hypothetical protein K1719_027314 [Acacia pycnantha]
MSLSLKEDARPPSADGLRSTKKVRLRSDVLDGGLEGDIGDSDVVMEEKVAVGGISYRSKLLNQEGNGGGYRSQEEVVVTDADFLISSDGDMPSIAFSQEVRDILAKGMERTVVIKLLGRSITYFDLLNRTRAIWRVKGSYRLVDMEGGFFFATFDLEEDYSKVLTGGPWMIFGAYLTVLPWSLDFDPSNAIISNDVVWIRIPGLSFRYYHKSTLRAIGRLLGEVFKIDYMTESRGRGRYARIAVLVDLHKPLVPWIKVDGKTFGVEYEGLPLICFECGRFGHAKDKCQLGKSAISVAVANTSANVAEGSVGKLPEDHGYGGDQLNNCVINAGGGNGSPAVKEVKSVQDPSPSSIGKATKQLSGLPKDPSKSWGKKVSQEGPSRSGLTEPMKVVTPHRNIQHASEWVPKIGKVNMDLTHGLVDSAGIGAKDTLVKSQDVIPLMVPSSLDSTRHSVVELHRPRPTLEEVLPGSGDISMGTQSDFLRKGSHKGGKENVGIKPPLAEDGKAQAFWDSTPDGKFSISSAYGLLCDVNDSDLSCLWEEVWQWEGAQRIRVFLWLAACRSLLTNSERRRRHMTWGRRMF